MPNHTRVLSQQDDFPSFEELRDFVRSSHLDCRLALESGDPDDWETLLLSTTDDIEIAVLERNPVDDGSAGQDEIADLQEDIAGCKPESSVDWLNNYLAEVRMVYSFQHLQGAETVDGSNALHALRAHIWERGESILQADGEGFTNEEGYHILWQFADNVSGPWSMGVYKDDLWHHFKMDLGDPDHRAAFLAGEVPDDLTGVHASVPRRD